MNKRVITWGEVLDAVDVHVAASMVKRNLIVRTDGKCTYETWYRDTPCTFPLPKNALRRPGQRHELNAACRSLITLHPEARR